MKLADVVADRSAPEPWSEGAKIPWNEPGFSRRMLAEHLTQVHDQASRRSETIDAQVAWIDEQLLCGHASRILDLGCGPGLYLQRLALRGHSGVGIDFSPASIEHARENGAPRVSYLEADLRELDAAAFESLAEPPFDLAMLLFGEANAFRPEELETLLRHTASSLSPGGQLLLEPHDHESIVAIGTQTPRWTAAPRGLFSERPHLCLHESFWDSNRDVATERWWIVDATTGETTRHAQSCQAYTEEAYRVLLERAGFEDVTFGPGLAPESATLTSGLRAIVASRREQP